MKVKNVLCMSLFAGIAVLIIFWLVYWPTKSLSMTLVGLVVSLNFSFLLGCLVAVFLYNFFSWDNFSGHPVHFLKDYIFKGDVTDAMCRISLQSMGEVSYYKIFLYVTFLWLLCACAFVEGSFRWFFTGNFNAMNGERRD